MDITYLKLITVVPQDSDPEPLFFHFIINDFPKMTKHDKIMKYSH